MGMERCNNTWLDNGIKLGLISSTMKNIAIIPLAFFACAASSEVRPQMKGTANPTAPLTQPEVDTRIRDNCRRFMDATANALHRVGSSCDSIELDILDALRINMQKACGRVPAQQRSPNVERERSRIADHVDFVIRGCADDALDEAGEALESVERKIDEALKKP